LSLWLICSDGEFGAWLNPVSVQIFMRHFSGSLIDNLFVTGSMGICLTSCPAGQI
jgi:hypothetical protein